MQHHPVRMPLSYCSARVRAQSLRGRDWRAAAPSSRTSVTRSSPDRRDDGARTCRDDRAKGPLRSRRLSLTARIPFELTVLLLAAAARLAAGQDILAAIMAAVVVLNALMLTALRQCPVI